MSQHPSWTNLKILYVNNVWISKIGVWKPPQIQFKENYFIFAWSIQNHLQPYLMALLLLIKWEESFLGYKIDFNIMTNHNSIIISFKQGLRWFSNANFGWIIMFICIPCHGSLNYRLLWVDRLQEIAHQTVAYRTIANLNCQTFAVTDEWCTWLSKTVYDGAEWIFSLFSLNLQASNFKNQEKRFFFHTDTHTDVHVRRLI